MKKTYIALDGDDVGRKLEYYMITNEKDKLIEFSSQFNYHIELLGKRIKDILDAEIIFSGGDNLLAETFNESPFQIMSDLSIDFRNTSSNTISIGIGGSPREAYFALKIAKASGKNCIKIYDEVSNE